MKVLVVSHDATRTGAPILLLNTLEEMKKRYPLELQILLKNGGELLSRFQRLGETYLLDWGYSFLPQGGTARLSPLLGFFGQKRPDLVYANTMTCGEVLSWLAPLKIPVVVHVHELEFAIDCAVSSPSLETTLREGLAFIAVSRAVRETLVGRYSLPPERVHLVYGAVPDDSLEGRLRVGEIRKSVREELGVAEETLLVGGAGSFAWHKAPDLFLQMARKVLSQRERKVLFLWVGGDLKSQAYAQIRHDVERLGIGEAMRFLGTTDRAQRYLGACDLFAMVSREDSFPLVDLEAASYGVPVVCFRGSGGASEFVDQGAGVSVPYLDLDSLSQEVVRFLDDPQRREEAGERARRIVERDHTLSSCAAKVYGVLQAACREGKERVSLRELLSLYAKEENPKACGEMEREILDRLQREGTVGALYNFASFLAKWGERGLSKELFLFIAKNWQEKDSGLAAKALYKLSETEEEAEKRRKYLERCLQLLPDHGLAKERLQELKSQAVREGKRGNRR